jgi:hypothetical protein
VLILLHCSISLNEVTSKTTQAGSRTAPAPLVRLLVFVLLAFVTHSATVEVVHQHGNLLPAGSSAASSFQGTNTDQSTKESSRSTGECLICQLHQHLFSTLLISVPGIAQPEAEITRAAHNFVPSQWEANAPQRGRAPPQSSLL